MLTNAEIIMATAQACSYLELNLREVWVGQGLKAVYTLYHDEQKTIKRNFFFFNRNVTFAHLVITLVQELQFEVGNTDGYMLENEYFAPLHNVEQK